MEKIWISSDTHFGHQREFLYEPRGFDNIYEHDKEVIKRWNSLVDEEDEVYLLGDVMLGDNNYGLSCLKQLNGMIHIVCGNHDNPTRKELYKTCHNVIEVCDGKFIQYKKWKFYLSHFPCRTTNFDDNKKPTSRVYNLCGHSHLKDPYADFDLGAFHVELDAHNCSPISIEDVIAAIGGKTK